MAPADFCVWESTCCMAGARRFLRVVIRYRWPFTQQEHMSQSPLPFDALVERISENPLALVRLAGVLVTKGDEAKAQALALRALNAEGADSQVRSLAAEILARGVPDWHFILVQDHSRNLAYKKTQRRAIAADT